MGHLAASEAYGDLDLVAGGYEFAGVIDFRVEIVRVDIERKPNFLNFDGFLIFSRLFLSFCLFKSEFSVVHYFADGRLSRRRYLDQIEIFFLGEPQSPLRGHYAELFAAVGNNPDLRVADFLVDLLFFAADVEAPPEKNKSGGGETPTSRKINVFSGSANR